MVDTTMSGLKDGEIIGIKITNENKHNGLEINLECVIITFNHGFSVFKDLALTDNLLK